MKNVRSIKKELMIDGVTVLFDFKIIESRIAKMYEDYINFMIEWENLETFEDINIQGVQDVLDKIMLYVTFKNVSNYPLKENTSFKEAISIINNLIEKGVFKDMEELYPEAKDNFSIAYEPHNRSKSPIQKELEESIERVIYKMYSLNYLKDEGVKNNDQE